MLTWKTLRSLRTPREKYHKQQSAKSKKAIFLENFKVKLTSNTIDTIYNNFILDNNSYPLLLIALCPVGPPILLHIGSILTNGEVLLDKGLDVNGVYWQSSDRTLFENGTIYYNQIDSIEQADVMFGTVSNDGVVSSLPDINGEMVSLDLLKHINMRHPTSESIIHPVTKTKTIIQDLKIVVDSILSTVHQRILNKRSTHQFSTYLKLITKLRFLLSLSKLYSTSLENTVKLEKDFQELACSLLSIQELEVFYLQHRLSPEKGIKITCYINTMKQICGF